MPPYERRVGFLMKKGGVTFPDGYLASGVHCGIKENGSNDLSLIFSCCPCTAAGVFTTNQIKAHSLLFSQKNIRNQVQAILINSGNANACNGPENKQFTQIIAEKTAALLEINVSSVLLASTGIIGKPLPHDKIVSHLDVLVKKLGEENHLQAANGIMTTDRFVKEIEVQTNIAGRKKEVFIGGMAKGAGMINPNMATMLAFLTTDAVIAQDALEQALREAVDNSFNMITVDNDQSTNDTVICLANGRARNPRIHIQTPEYRNFADSLKNACIKLAKDIVSDGEGSTKCIEVSVKGGWCKKDVRKVAKRIAGSNLLKCAVGGNWPNWGRILSAIGSTNARINVSEIEVSLCSTKVYKGRPIDFDSEKLSGELEKSKHVIIEIDLKRGSFEATAFGCDMTTDYVEINKSH